MIRTRFLDSAWLLWCLRRATGVTRTADHAVRLLATVRVHKRPIPDSEAKKC